MFPAYSVSPEDILEVLFAISELDDSSDKQISQFCGHSERKVRESIHVLEEIGVLVENGESTIDIQYEDLIQQLPLDDRATIVEEALLEYQPFIDYATYLDRGYDSEQAAQMVNAGDSQLASKAEYVQSYFERLGRYAGVLTAENRLSKDVREIPIDSTASIEKLREALDSELEVRVYLNDLLGEELMAFLDEDTKSDLADSFVRHSIEPRDSISASGRAFEDFLRNVGDRFGSDDRDYSSASGIVPVCNHLQGDDLVRRIHKRRVFALAEIRNKGGAHGDDTEVLERWETSPELSLNQALTTAQLIRSIFAYASEEELVL